MIGKQVCDRCRQPTIGTIMSTFNTEQICIPCKDAEKLRPDYPAAAAAEEEAVRRGDFNFKGIGLNYLGGQK